MEDASENPEQQAPVEVAAPTTEDSNPTEQNNEAREHELSQNKESIETQQSNTLISTEQSPSAPDESNVVESASQLPEENTTIAPETASEAPPPETEENNETSAPPVEEQEAKLAQATGSDELGLLGAENNDKLLDNNSSRITSASSKGSAKGRKSKVSIAEKEADEVVEFQAEDPTEAIESLKLQSSMNGHIAEESPAQVASNLFENDEDKEEGEGEEGEEQNEEIDREEQLRLEEEAKRLQKEAEEREKLEREAAEVARLKRLDDEGWITDLDITEITKRKNTMDIYEHSCKVLGIVPVSYFAERLSSTDISMKNHGLGAKGAQAIAEVLEYNNTIQNLDLTGNDCRQGGFYIGQSLRTNQTLVTIDLSKNNLGINGGKEFSEMLTENTTLKTLILSDNKITDNEATFLASSLKSNNTLQYLDLSYNQIGDIGASELGSGIGSNEGLKELNLNWNEIRPKGTSAFFSGIKDNVTLTTLKFDNNGIYESGAPIAFYLQRTLSLYHFSLSSTRLSDGALTLIAKGLEASISLKEFNISDNPFTETSAIVLFKCLALNNSLETLLMKNIRLGKEGRMKLDELAELKPKLQILE